MKAKMHRSATPTLISSISIHLSLSLSLSLLFSLKLLYHLAYTPSGKFFPGARGMARA